MVTAIVLDITALCTVRILGQGYLSMLFGPVYQNLIGTEQSRHLDEDKFGDTGEGFILKPTEVGGCLVLPSPPCLGVQWEQAYLCSEGQYLNSD